MEHSLAVGKIQEERILFFLELKIKVVLLETLELVELMNNFHSNIFHKSSFAEKEVSMFEMFIHSNSIAQFLFMFAFDLIDCSLIDSPEIVLCQEVRELRTFIFTFFFSIS